MAHTKRIISILLITTLVLFSIGITSAKSVKLELCTDKNCYNYEDDIQLNYNESIILKMSIINEEGKFMCWKGIQYNFKYISDNIGDFNNKGEKYVSGGFYGDNSKDVPFCFSDSKKILNEVYIPLWDYNEIEPSKRLGSWAISSFKLILNGLTYYQDVSLSKSVSGSSWNNQDSFEGNEIRFTVIIEEPKKWWFGGIKNEVFKFGLRGLNLILVGIAVFLWGHIFTTNKRKKPYSLAWILTIASIILALLGFV